MDLDFSNSVRLTAEETLMRIDAAVASLQDACENLWQVRQNDNWKQVVESQNLQDCDSWQKFCDLFIGPKLKKWGMAGSRIAIDRFVEHWEAQLQMPTDRLREHLSNNPALSRALNEAHVPVSRFAEVIEESLRTAPVRKCREFPNGIKQNSAAHVKATAERLLAPSRSHEAPPPTTQIRKSSPASQPPPEPMVNVGRDFFGEEMRSAPPIDTAFVPASEPSTELAVLPPVPAADVAVLSMAANTAIAATLASEADTEANEADEEEESDNEAGYAEQSVDFPPLAELPNNPISAMRYDPHADCIWLTVCKNNQRPFALHISGKRLRYLMGIGTH